MDNPERCPKCGKPSASPPAEVYCVDCATEGYEQDAERWRAHRAATERGAVSADPEVEHLMAAVKIGGKLLDDARARVEQLEAALADEKRNGAEIEAIVDRVLSDPNSLVHQRQLQDWADGVEGDRS